MKSTVPPTRRPQAKPGRHRIRLGTPLPGFGRVGATPAHYTVQTILRRHNREIATMDELEQRRDGLLGETQ